MEFERALEISGDLVKAYLPAFAGFEVAPADLAAVVERLKTYTLAELLEATRTVDAENTRLIEVAKEEKRGMSLNTVVADRAVAAIYAILHHEPVDHVPGETPQPLCVLERTGLFLIRFNEKGE